MLSAELERKQMRINAQNGADCVGRFRKIANGTGNFDLYYYPEGGYVMSVAKWGSGCRSSVYGSISYVMFQVKRGIINPHALTKYGRRMLQA